MSSISQGKVEAPSAATPTEKNNSIQGFTKPARKRKSPSKVSQDLHTMIGPDKVLPTKSVNCFRQASDQAITGAAEGTLSRQQPERDTAARETTAGAKAQKEVIERGVHQQQFKGITHPNQLVRSGIFPQLHMQWFLQQFIVAARAIQFAIETTSATMNQGLDKNATMNHGLDGSSNAKISSQNHNNFAGGTCEVDHSYGTANVSPDGSKKKGLDMLRNTDGLLPQKLRHLEPNLIERVLNDIMDPDLNVRWNDIAGLDHAKQCVTEMIVWPLLRPDLFKGCRSPGKGLLLFGPPGTGKTMIGKAIAREVEATFFHISVSSLASKWVGDGEKLVKALFGVASCLQPAVIFFDEIDAILFKRQSGYEPEHFRRLKTQLLVEMDGFDSENERLLIIGATNRPQDLDEAARRRLSKRLYIPLPSEESRAYILCNILENDGLLTLSEEDIDAISCLTEGYSGSDMKNLVKDASVGPLRDAIRQGTDIRNLKAEDLRPVTFEDFENSMDEVRPSVSPSELGAYSEWNEKFGSVSF